MSSELDQFVIQYTVELKDSIARLERLNSKVDSNAKATKRSASQVKEFAAEATGELGKLIPGLDKASAGIRALGTGFTVAAAAAATLAVGVKAVMDMREQYGEQRKQGMEIGVSAIQLEEIQRKMVAQSGGKITREQVAEELKKVSQFQQEVAMDYSGVGQQTKTARVLGLDMGKSGVVMNPVDVLTKLAEKLQTMTDAQAQAVAGSMGLNKDFISSLKAEGSQIGKITKMTLEDVKSRKAADQSLNDLNDAISKLQENFRMASNELSQHLLPALTEFIKIVSDVVKALPEKREKVVNELVKESTTGGNFEPMGFFEFSWKAAKKLTGSKNADEIKAEKEGKTLLQVKAEREGKVYDATKDPMAVAAKNVSGAATSVDALTKDVAKEASNKVAISDSEMKAAQEAVDAENERNRKAREIQIKNDIAIKMFAGAVATFANAIDEKQAWAAWAGEVGRASGLNEGVSPSTTLPEPSAPIDNGIGSVPSMRQPMSTKYDDIFKAAGSKYGIDPELLKNIARVESGFNPNAKSSVGAMGLMQVMPSNFKSAGITDALNPEQNIFGGAKVFSDFLKSTGGDVTKALKRYHGGYDEKNWGKNTNAYPDKVLGKQQDQNLKPRGIGETKEDINLKSVQNTIAQRLGVPVQQLQFGGINRGDVAFANQQLQTGISNQIFDLKNQLRATNLPQQQFSKIVSEIQAQQTGLMMMQKYGDKVVGRAKEGGRSITLGERSIVINFENVPTPEETARHVKEQLDIHLNEWANGTATGVKW